MKNIETRGVIALVAVLGSITLAFVRPDYGVAAISVLSTCAGGYFGQMTPNNKDRE